MADLVGIEIGGTKLQIVEGDRGCRIRKRHRQVVDRGGGAAGIRKQIEVTLGGLEMRAAAIGVGFGGPVDWKTGRVARSHQIEGWSGFDLAGWLRRFTDGPVLVDNDANVAALGEARHGAGAGVETVFYVTLGSGVGGGCVIDGKIYHGATPGEAEIGHIRLDPGGRIVEECCSGWAVDRMIREAVQRGAEGTLAEKVKAAPPGGEARWLGQSLPDPLATEILKRVTGNLAFALSHVVHLFHPEVIILGGGLSLVGEPLRAAIEEKLRGYVMETFRDSWRVELSALGEDAVPIGALELTRSKD